MQRTCLCRAAALVALLPVGAVLAQPGGGTIKRPLPSKAVVLSAISRMMRVVGENAAKPPAPTRPGEKAWMDDMKLVAGYAQDSSDVTIAINPRLAATTTKEDVLYLAYYLAGATRYDLQNPKRATDPYADQAAAVRAELLAYRYTKARGAKMQRPLLDDLQAKNAAGTLEKYVAQVAKMDAKAAPRKR